MKKIKVVNDIEFNDKGYGGKHIIECKFRASELTFDDEGKLTDITELIQFPAKVIEIEVI